MNPSAPRAASPPSPASLKTLLELTQIPTVAGREHRVIEFLRRWVQERPALALTADNAGNLVIQPTTPWSRSGSSSPIFITAHLDHPAFVVQRALGPRTLELAFRGGVMDPYFENARVRVHGESGASISATLTGAGEGASAAVASAGPALFKSYIAELDANASFNDRDLATWDLPAAELDAHGIVHTHACDDLAAAAAALDAYDNLLALAGAGERVEDVRLLFTRAEEIGFIGAIAACKLGTMPQGSRVIALENSRAFADSPIGGGPIVRVGDRMSVFTPRLTAACARRAEQISLRPAQPLATQTRAQADAAGATDSALRWQRKLMAGGACEASVFCAYGYAATCLCLPLGNYHNMADLAAVQDGTYDTARLGPPRVAREFISAADYLGMVELLTAIGRDLPEADPSLEKIEMLYATRAFVLSERR